MEVAPVNALLMSPAPEMNSLNQMPCTGQQVYILIPGNYGSYQGLPVGYAVPVSQVLPTPPLVATPPPTPPSTPPAPPSDDEVPALTASSARRQRRKRAAERAKQAQVDQAPALTLPELRQGLREDPVKALEALRGHVWTWSRNEMGCRLVQEALETGSQAAGELASELQTHVLEAATCPHANYVLQKVGATWWSI